LRLGLCVGWYGRSRRSNTLSRMSTLSISPIKGLGRAVLLADDADAAVAFYHRALGFRVLHDQTTDGYRRVHIGVPGQDGVGVWLIPVSGEDDRAVVGRQSGRCPLLVLYAKDLQAVDDRLRGLHVRTWDERDDPESSSLHMADLHGNVIVIAQLREPQI
jgi:catechol 2,3-dioxygenase-like lactoylglutathione lyase family enzyme